MLQGLIEGRDPGELAQRARGRMRSKLEDLEKALEGPFRKEHAFLLKRLLMQTRTQLRPLEMRFASRSV